VCSLDSKNCPFININIVTCYWPSVISTPINTPSDLSDIDIVERLRENQHPSLFFALRSKLPRIPPILIQKDYNINWPATAVRRASIKDKYIHINTNTIDQQSSTIIIDNFEPQNQFSGISIAVTLAIVMY
jgi:hypothetical protein